MVIWKTDSNWVSLFSSPSCYVTADGPTINLVWEARTEDRSQSDFGDTTSAYSFSMLSTIIPPSCPGNPPTPNMYVVLSIVLNLKMGKVRELSKSNKSNLYCTHFNIFSKSTWWASLCFNKYSSINFWLQTYLYNKVTGHLPAIIGTKMLRDSKN